MLLEEDKLRWLGLDMRAQWRRRMLVVLTYAIYLAAICRQWPRLSALSFLLYFVGTDWNDFSRNEGAGGSGAAWTIRFFYTSLVWAQVYLAWTHPNSLWIAMSAFYALLWLWFGSALGPMKLVDRGDRGWVAQTTKNPVWLSPFRQRMLALQGFVTGLNGYAYYEYKKKFRELTAEQKFEIQELHRAHPRGEWKQKPPRPLFDDERLQQEEQKLRAQVQRILSWIFVLGAIVLTFVLDGQRTVDKNTVLFVLWLLAGLVTTLRQAIVLWTEKDPRDFVGEIALVDGAHA